MDAAYVGLLQICCLCGTTYGVVLIGKCDWLVKVPTNVKSSCRQASMLR